MSSSLLFGFSLLLYNKRRGRRFSQKRGVLMEKQPAERSLQNDSQGSFCRKASEVSFDSVLRQAALKAVHALAPGTVLDQHQAGVFQQMNQAMLGAYLQQYEMPPSPDEIQ